MKSRHHDGVDPNWFHFNCFFKKASQWGLGQGEIDKIAGFHELRIEDQDRVKKAVNEMSGITVKGAKSGKARQILNDFEIGYASSSRSSCRYGDCKINDCKIEKG